MPGDVARLMLSVESLQVRASTKDLNDLAAASRAATAASAPLSKALNFTSSLSSAHIAVAQQIADLGGLGSAQRGARGAIDATNTSFTDFFRNLLNSREGMSGVVGGFLRLGTGAYLVGRAIQTTTGIVSAAVKPLIENAAAMESMVASYGALLGSKSAGTNMVSYLKDLATTLPVTVSAMSNGTKTLLGFGFAANEIQAVLPRIAALAMGNSEAFDHLAVVYGQVRAQGKMYMNDLRQFTNAGVPMIEALADVMKAPQAEIGNLIRDGKVGLTQVKEALELITDEGGRFHDTLTAAADTFNGQLTLMSNEFKLFASELGKPIVIALKFGLKELVNPALEFGRATLPIFSSIATFGLDPYTKEEASTTYGLAKRAVTKNKNDTFAKSVMKSLEQQYPELKVASPRDKKDMTDTVFGVWRPDQPFAVDKIKTYTKGIATMDWLASAGFNTDTRLAQILMNMGLDALPNESETIGFDINEWVKANLDPMAGKLLTTPYALTGDKTTPYTQQGQQYQALKALRTYLVAAYGKSKGAKDKNNYYPGYGATVEAFPEYYMGYDTGANAYLNTELPFPIVTGEAFPPYYMGYDTGANARRRAPYAPVGRERSLERLNTYTTTRGSQFYDYNNGQISRRDDTLSGTMRPDFTTQGSMEWMNSLAGGGDLIRKSVTGMEQALDGALKSSYIDSAKALGKALHDGGNGAEAIGNALKANAANYMDQVAPLLLEAGLTLVIENAANPVGWAMIMASGLMSFGSGWTTADISSKTSTSAEWQAKADAMYKYYIAAEAFNRETLKASNLTSGSAVGTGSASRGVVVHNYVADSADVTTKTVVNSKGVEELVIGIVKKGITKGAFGESRGRALSN
jgi:tape measure domain-containing protein